jgi:hypothetical protein
VSCSHFLCSHFILIDILTKLASSNMDCVFSSHKQTKLNNKVKVLQKCITQAIEHKTETRIKTHKMTKIIILPLLVLATMLSSGSAQGCSGLTEQQCRGTDGCAWIGRCIWEPSNLDVVSLEADKYDDDYDSSILVGTNWQLSDINGAPAIRDEYEGLQGLSFSSEFELSGFDGCNQFSAEWNTVPSSSMITVNLGRRTRRGCGWMTEEQDIQMRDFMGVLLHQDAIAYSLSEDEQELTLYTDDAPTMTLTRIVDDDDLEEDDEGDKIGEGDDEEEQMKDESELTVVGAEYISISSGPPNDHWIARCLRGCEDLYERCLWGHREDHCRRRRDGCFDNCVN